jgi:hypothetical protein
MTDYDNTNSGVLFHESAPESEKHPDYTGNINVDGKDYRLAGWKRTGKSGVPFLSLKISEHRAKQSGYDSFKNSRPQPTKTSNSPSVDVALEYISDAPIDLSEIPF